MMRVRNQLSSRIREFPSVLLVGIVLTLFLSAPALWAGPTVVPTAEGQIGETPSTLDTLLGARLEPTRGQPPNVLAGALRRPLTITPGAGFEFDFFTDMIHGYPEPMPLPIVSESTTMNEAFELRPESARSPKEAGNGDYVAFSYATDGSGPGLINIIIRLFDESLTQINAMTINDIQAVPGFPNPFLSDTGVAVDNQGRVTVAYTEIGPMNFARIQGQRFDGLTGLPIGGELPITDDGHASSSVALLDPAGNRMVVASSDFNSVQGNIVDLSGPTPVVSPEFPISTTTAAFGNFNQQVAADPTTGVSMAVWENNSGNVGNPLNIRARRFDADGNPLGEDFQVNTTSANAQGQPDVAMAGGLAAVVWAGDSLDPSEQLDVFLQVYAPDGQPIGGEIKVNSDTEGFQDRPSVRFLPDLDAQGRPQVAVAWRDVANSNGTGARGTGTGYRCFAIDGLEPPEIPIFADGFESGDTLAWSVSSP